MLKKQHIMTKNEYFTVSEVSKKFDVSARNVRKIIGSLETDTSNLLLHKDKKHRWLIHRLLLPKFKPQRKKKNKYYALTIDPCMNLSQSDIHKTMNFIVEKVEDNTLELNYTIETKKSHGQNHIHCFIKCKEKKALLEFMKLGYGKMNYYESVIYDLNGWREYITKENKNLTTILKKEQNGTKRL